MIPTLIVIAACVVFPPLIPVVIGIVVLYVIGNVLGMATRYK